MSQKDYFRILGITRNSGPEEIKRAYREKAFRYHPDTSGGGQEAAECFREIREAYDVLSDRNTRTRHERELDSHNIPVGRSYHQPRTNHDSGTDYFAPLTREGFRGICASRQTRFPSAGYFDRFLNRCVLGEHGVYDFSITAAEARNGTERNLRIDMPYKAVRITVEIPPGVEEGALLEVVGPRTRRLGIQIFLRARILD